VDLADVLDVLPDPRRRQGHRYRLGALLALCTIAVLAGATSLVAVARQAAYLPEEIRDRLGLRAAPRATILGRVLARLDGDTVDAAIGVWLAPHCTSSGESDDLCAVAVDGKTLRGSRTATRRAVHLVAAVTHGERVALNQRQVPGKKGEITAFVPLLAPLDLAASPAITGHYWPLPATSRCPLKGALDRSPGDQVADQDGRIWRFDAAWDWHPFDEAQPSAPAWPHALPSRNGEPTSEEAAAVARATAVGSHAEKLERWTELTLARPSPRRQWPCRDRTKSGGSRQPTRSPGQRRRPRSIAGVLPGPE
jgi:hypothetical protein